MSKMFVMVLDGYNQNSVVGQVLEDAVNEAHLAYIRKPEAIWVSCPEDLDFRKIFTKHLSDISWICGYKFQVTIINESSGNIIGTRKCIDDGFWSYNPTALEWKDISPNLQKFVLETVEPREREKEKESE